MAAYDYDYDQQNSKAFELIENMVNNMVRPVVSSFNNIIKTRREYQ
jgi:microcystin degradation protein MlrC